MDPHDRYLDETIRKHGLIRENNNLTVTDYQPGREETVLDAGFHYVRGRRDYERERVNHVRTVREDTIRTILLHGIGSTRIAESIIAELQRTEISDDYAGAATFLNKIHRNISAVGLAIDAQSRFENNEKNAAPIERTT
jgi:hypothetical protein